MIQLTSDTDVKGQARMKHAKTAVVATVKSSEFETAEDVHKISRHCSRDEKTSSEMTKRNCCCFI